MFFMKYIAHQVTSNGISRSAQKYSVFVLQIDKLLVIITHAVVPGRSDLSKDHCIFYINKNTVINPL